MPVKFFRASDRYENVRKMAEEGIVPGLKTGFHHLDNRVSFKKGYTTLIYGAPRSGKSQLLTEVMNSMSAAHGTVNTVYLPEAGDDDEVVGDILMNYLSRRFFGEDFQSVSIDDFDKGIEFIDKHYRIISYKESVDLYDMIDVAQGSDLMAIDHFGWMRRYKGQERTPLFEYVKNFCQKAYIGSKKYGLHTIFVNHTSAENKTKEDKDTGIVYNPKPHPDHIAGGSEWFKNSYQVISVWRPPFGVMNPKGFPYKENEVHITVEKSKPKGIGREGVVTMYFDEKRQGFYEEVDGFSYYVGEHNKMHKEVPSEPAHLSPSKLWDDDDDLFDDEPPF